MARSQDKSSPRATDVQQPSNVGDCDNEAHASDVKGQSGSGGHSGKLVEEK